MKLTENDLCYLSSSLSNLRMQQPHKTMFPWETKLKIARLAGSGDWSGDFKIAVRMRYYPGLSIRITDAEC